MLHLEFSRILEDQNYRQDCISLSDDDSCKKPGLELNKVKVQEASKD